MSRLNEREIARRLAEPLDAAERGRRRETCLRGPLLVRRPRIVLQRGQKGQVDSVEVGQTSLHTNRIR